MRSKCVHQKWTQILCTDDIITAMNEAVNLHSVNQHHQILVKYFPIEFNIDGINKDIQHIKYDYVSIETIKTLYLL